MPKISSVIIAWNEEASIKKCLESLSKVSDEILVVIDDATTDKTEEIAKKYASKIIHHAHTGIVEPMRQFAIDSAKNDWVLLLDADESLSPELSGEIRSLNIAQTNFNAYSIPRLNYFFGRPVLHTNWDPKSDRQVRLFKKDSISWPVTIHSSPKITGLTGQLNNFLLHDNYDTISEFLEKTNRYTSRDQYFSNPIYDFLRRFIYHQGYKDGWLGLFLSILMSIYHLTGKIKQWERKQSLV